MPIIRCQMVLPGASGLAEDRFVNTLHLDATAGLAGADDYAEALDEFWNDTIAAPPGPPSAFISEWVVRAQCSFRFYDLADAEPRVPVVIPFTMGPKQSLSSPIDLPEEVAVCLSIHGAPPITGRRRGRMFIGPLNSAAITEASTASPSRTSTNIRSSLSTHAIRLQASLEAVGATWVIHSPTSGDDVPVVGGWIDDAVDIQRRRGPDPATRSNWSIL